MIRINQRYPRQKHHQHLLPKKKRFYYYNTMLRISRGSLLQIALVTARRTVQNTSLTRFQPQITLTSQWTRTYAIKTTSGAEASDQVQQFSINEFHSVSDDYLELLTDHLLELGEEFPGIDAEYSHGVLTLELPPNGTYVINKQPPNKQIWLSSPVSGPDRFDPIDGQWVSLRTKEKLGDILRRELSTAINQDITLDGIDD